MAMGVCACMRMWMKMKKRWTQSINKTLTITGGKRTYIRVYAHYTLQRIPICLCVGKNFTFVFSLRCISHIYFILCGWNGCRRILNQANQVIQPRIMFWYYRLLALHPNWIAFIVFTLSSVCIFVSLTFEEIPDFTDPALVCVRTKSLDTLLGMKMCELMAGFDFILGFWITWNRDIKPINFLA